MDLINAATMGSLVRHDTKPCVSIYLPTHRSGRETRQGPIRLGNLLDRAHDELVDSGMRAPEAAELLGEARLLTESGWFWQHQEDGLAVFAAPGFFASFRLPVTFEELVVAADAFHIKPLWPVVSGDELFFLLALSRNEVRLLTGDRFRIADVDLPEDVPESLAEALWFDDPEKQLQHHGASRAGRGRVVAQFHGHGVSDERGGEKLEMFLRAVDRGIRQLIDPNVPLVLAGVEDLMTRFRQASEQQTIADEVIAGNPEELTPLELHQRALPIVRPLLEKAVAEDAAAFLAAGERAASTVTGAVAAAMTGRVSSIFLPIGVQVWGNVGSDGMDMVVHESRVPGDRDLLDLAGTAVWSAGGRVHAVPPDLVPGGGPVAALLRY